MARVYTYLIIIIVLTMVLTTMGVPTAFNETLSHFGLSVNDQTISSSSFWNSLFSTTGILILTGVGIAIGFITKSSPENFIILPLITGSMVGWASAFYSIINYGKELGGWVSPLILILMGAISVGYLFSLIEFFRGGA